MTSELGNLLASSELMPPPGPRPATRLQAPVVLEEDEWTEKIEAIVRRDFFPDVPKLESELEWLQAQRSGDPLVMRAAQANIALRRTGVRTPIGVSPATFATPSLQRTPGLATPAMTPGLDRTGGGQPVPDDTPQETLDKFLAKHTSEDNANFAEILDTTNQKRLEKLESRGMGDRPPDSVLLLEGPREAAETDGYGTTGQPSAGFISWPHVPKNQLYFDSSQQAPLALTESELAQQVQGPPRSLSHAATRFAGTVTEDALPAAKRVRGAEYAPVQTPDINPGEGDESPFMTWGELAGTPMRLEDEDAALAAARGPHFSVPEPRSRDELARRMAQRARTSLLRKATARRATPSGLFREIQSPGRWAMGGGTPVMSPAAKRLASSVRVKDDANAALRASYTGSQRRTSEWEGGAATPAVTPRLGPTPLLGTPRLPQKSKPPLGKKAGATTAVAGKKKQEEEAAGEKRSTGHLTDNLLDI